MGVVAGVVVPSSGVVGGVSGGVVGGVLGGVVGGVLGGVVGGVVGGGVLPGVCDFATMTPSTGLGSSVTVWKGTATRKALISR